MELTSERLVLRPTDLRDLDFYVELRNHPEILALPRRQPRPRSDVERQLRRWIERWQEHGFGAWTVFGRKTQERLGRVEFDPMGPGSPGIAPDEIELGCIVHPTYRNLAQSKNSVTSARKGQPIAPSYRCSRGRRD